MPCRWKTKGFSSGEDCVAKMTGKVDDPEGFCYGPAEAFRHRDFQRIYDEFVNYYKDTVKGEGEYYSWLKALSLNEEREYGQARESFKWAKHMLQFLREDKDNKYYSVLIGFPIESMNGNVYKERDLIAATMRLKGKCPSLNHKDEFWFSPDNPKNKWGNLPIVDAKFEGGASEAILQVPKTAVCPICSGAKMTELIDNKRIVNVSLEGSCTREVAGECEGFEYGDPPFTLLTSDVLPGIPLARIKPLEHIMVEALQSSTKTDRRKNKVTKLVMEAIEQDEETDEHGCIIGKQTWDAENEKCVAIPTEQAEPCPEGKRRNPDTGECEPIPQEEQVTTVDITPIEPKPSMEPDEHGQCEPGYRLNKLGKCVETEECGEGRHWDANANEGQGGCVADTPPKPEHPETAHGLPAAPREDVLTDAPTEQPKTGEQPPMLNPPKLPSAPAAGEQPAVTGHVPESEEPMEPTEPGEIKPKEPHTCQDGMHFDADLDQCVPDSPIAERVKRFQAEDKADSLQTKLAKMEKRYVELDTIYQQSLGKIRAEKQLRERLEKQIDRYNVEKVNDEVQLRDKKRRVEDLTLARDEYKDQLEKLQKLHDDLNRKYNKTIGVNLELSRKLTNANEDILTLGAKNERLKAQMNKAKSISKKITRLKA